MKQLLIAGVLVVTSGPVFANAIERACLSSDRQAANRTLCGCIQDVADLTLSASEQRRAASMFKDPHQTQELRQSKARRDETFWVRYKAFGQHAKTYCS